MTDESKITVKIAEPFSFCLYLNEKFADVFFVIDGVRLPAHRAILAARNEYFESLLFGGLRESQQTEIELQVPLEVFKLVLKFIYTGAVDVPFEGDFSSSTLFSFVRLAHEYQLMDAIIGVSDGFSKRIGLANVCDILNALQLYQVAPLMEACYAFVDENASSFLKHESFLKLQQEALIGVLRRDTFGAAEPEIFVAVQAWRDANPEADIKAVLKNVRLGLMPCDFLLDKVLSSKLLDQEELLSLIKRARESAVKEIERESTKMCYYSEPIDRDLSEKLYSAESIVATKTSPWRIFINLGNIFDVNYIKFIIEVCNGDKISVSFSENDMFWTRMLIQPNTNVIQLPFNTCLRIKYIRIEWLNAIKNQVCSIKELEVFKAPETRLWNVASLDAGAKLVDGSMFNDQTLEASKGETAAIAAHSYIRSDSNGSITIQFARAFHIAEIRAVFSTTPQTFRAFTDYGGLPINENIRNIILWKKVNHYGSMITFTGQTSGQKFLELYSIECLAKS